jgi:hypothetical protein
MRGRSKPFHREAPIRTLVVSLIGVAAVTAVLLCRQQKLVATPGLKEVPAGENMPGTISLERLRELGY